MRALSRKRAISGGFAAAAFLLAALVAPRPALAAGASGGGGEKEKYVPRSEYKALKKEFRKFKKEMRHRIRRREKAKKQLMKAERKHREKGFRLAPKVDFKPGWERARPEVQMSLGKVDEMSVQIAKVGDMDLYMGLDTAGRIQHLQQDDTGLGGGSLEPGFQTAWGNFSFLADFNSNLEVYFDVFIASRPHPDQLQGNEGYMLMRDLPSSLGDNTVVERFFEIFDIKAGEFEIDFGDAHFRRSTNAKVQQNPLIGNYVVDPRATDIGGELIASGLPVKALVGVGTGGGEGDFQNDAGYSLHGKVWGEPIEDLRPSASVFYVDHSGNPTGFPNTGTSHNLFSSSRSGGPYAAIFGGGNAPGQIEPGAGQRVLAAQADLTWSPEPVELYGHFGWMEDSNINGSAPGTPRDSWFYYAAECKYNFTKRLYTALRYSGAAANDVNGVSSNGLIHRVQVGGGYWLYESVLAKLEYVYQFYDNFDSGVGTVGGVDPSLDPNFNGVIAEVSFAF